MNNRIADYVHGSVTDTAPDVVQRDPRPGNYYVSAQDIADNASTKQRCALLAGPYDTHDAALAMVRVVKAKALTLDVRACWYSYGTARIGPEHLHPPRGSLNHLFGLPGRKVDA